MFYVYCNQNFSPQHNFCAGSQNKTSQVSIDLHVHCNFRIKMRELLEKGFEMLVRMPHVIDCAHFSDAVHRKLGRTDINCSNPHPTGKNGTDGWSTRHVVADNKILQCKWSLIEIKLPHGKHMIFYRHILHNRKHEAHKLSLSQYVIRPESWPA